MLAIYQVKTDSENDLNTLTISTAFTEEGLPVGNLCVMTGMWSGTITENIDADIQLKRSLAKIKFAYSVGGENFSFIPSTLELCNVPKVMKYTERMPQNNCQVTEITKTILVLLQGPVVFIYGMCRKTRQEWEPMAGIEQRKRRVRG